MTSGETIRWHGPFVGGRILLPEGHFSGIAKQSISDELMLGRLGFAGDLQADTRQHGGPERAVCVYPLAAYRHWAGIYPRRADDFVPGAFGENLCCEGIDEAEASPSRASMWPSSARRFSRSASRARPAGN